MVASDSRRQRKKIRTREEIVRAAQRLFAKRGYHGTTVADIADAADVALSTVFAYFPTKDDIVFHAHPALQKSFVEALESRAQGATSIDAFRAWVGEHLINHCSSGDKDERVLRRIIDSDERLLAQERYRTGYFEEQFAIAIANDFGDSPDDLRPRLMAGAAVGAMTAALTYVRRFSTPQSRERAMSAVAEILDAARERLAHTVQSRQRRP